MRPGKPSHQRVKALRASIFLAFALVSQIALAGIVSPYNSDRRARVLSDFVVWSDTDNGFGFGTTTLSSVHGDSSASLETNWIDTGTGALFDQDFALAFSGSVDDSAEVYEHYARFMISSDTTFDLTGQFDVTDFATPARVSAQVRLRDLSTNTDLFYDRNDSVATLNESFTLGVANDGDSFNNTYGSLTGSLQAGHSYELNYFYYLGGQSGSYQDVSANGCVTLSIGGATGAGSCGMNPTSVPSPGSAWLMLIGILACALRYGIRTNHAT